MRVAVLSDIHGNAVALEAVLADAEALGVEAYWIIGDHVAIGPEPGAVLDRLARLPDARFTRGNTDRYVLTGETPPPALSVAQANPTLVPLYAAVRASFAWTKGFMTAHGGLEWLSELPLDIRFECADGVSVVAVHAAPGTDDGAGVHPGLSNAAIAELVSVASADLVLVGHTHEPLSRRVGRQLVVNVGSVSNPRAPDLRASYVMLESSWEGTMLTHRRVAYDRAAFTESVQRSQHPAADYILSFQRGEQRGRAPHPDHTPVVSGTVVRIRQ